ncbi:hypothetical protein DBT_1044 [Dissulfuribacter thermophilus]|uniref:Uncharacterized protein n=1 Tax=Dissulfuribacter thermophilus TaxID=1156395 RepID=A0A1B9F731_9BACT|nr:DUF166 family (seleno)protein DfsP [Dissulfuribacter thermophilus]OCC15693.1 hypothetical protein DBT_1044 [Dissulfuribacter thermophilus]
MKVIVFEERGSGRRKIQGIETYGKGIQIIDVIDVGGPFPEFVEEPEDLVQGDFSVDLCLNFVKHPDISQYIVDLYTEKGIPVVASGQKVKGAITPFTCCGLGEYSSLGQYGRLFGVPKLKVRVEQNRIVDVEVLRGAPCGITWEKAKSLVGLDPDEALSTFGRIIQYECVADPSNFDPISQKSQLHYAGDVHIKALKKALELVKLG